MGPRVPPIGTDRVIAFRRPLVENQSLVALLVFTFRWVTKMQEALDNQMEIARKNGQAHLFHFWDALSPEEQQQLLSQVGSIDFAAIAKLYQGTEESVNWQELSNQASPPDAIRINDLKSKYSVREAIECGEQAIRNGKVGMILVAGGQGTRLGFDQPKGLFRIGPVSNRTLFAMHADSLLGTMRRYNVSIPLYVMTSPATDKPTREYFSKHQNLGLQDDELVVFCQGTMPALDAFTGQILLESPSSIALSPDGHGGIVSALDQQGILRTAASRGIEHFFYAQVDNPLVRACDPLLIGYHLLAGSEMTTQVVSKRFATEKVGNVVSIDGRTHIIEYSDLPDDVAHKVNSEGSLFLWAGNIAIHVLDRKFLERAATENDGLPFHRASKSVPFVNNEGELLKPKTPNAIKFERFVFDLLPQAAKAIVVEGAPEEVFAPVKNAEGSATDTPTSTRNAIVQQHRKWLEKAGLDIASGVKVEINPRWALDADEVQTKILKPANIVVDTYFA
jgi:UDP-N-acetylglucosamine/UDP-N-acetylgalactosamine diphosphorylase